MGIRQAQQSGRYANLAPFGYLNNREPGQRSMIVVDESKAVIVQKIFRDYLCGISQFLIQKDVENLGFKQTANGAIARILANPVYAGLVWVTGTANEPERIIKGVHEAIITEAEYWRAQELIEANRREENPHPKSEFPLKTLLYAPCCGGKVTAGRTKGYSKRYVYYRCIKHSGTNLSGAKMHKKMELILAHLSFKQEHIDRIAQKVLTGFC